MSDIKVDGAEDYQRSVQEQLTKIRHNPIGNLIVRSIEDGKQDGKRLVETVFTFRAWCGVAWKPSW